MFRPHRITLNSRKVGIPWYDNRRNEWQRYTCGVTEHGDCSHTLATKTGRKLPKEKK